MLQQTEIQSLEKWLLEKNRKLQYFTTDNSGIPLKAFIKEGRIEIDQVSSFIQLWDKPEEGIEAFKIFNELIPFLPSIQSTNPLEWKDWLPINPDHLSIILLNCKDEHIFKVLAIFKKFQEKMLIDEIVTMKENILGLIKKFPAILSNPNIFTNLIQKLSWDDLTMRLDDLTQNEFKIIYSELLKGKHPALKNLNLDTLIVYLKRNPLHLHPLLSIEVSEFEDLKNKLSKYLTVKKHTIDFITKMMRPISYQEKYKELFTTLFEADFFNWLKATDWIDIFKNNPELSEYLIVDNPTGKQQQIQNNIGRDINIEEILSVITSSSYYKSQVFNHFFNDNYFSSLTEKKIINDNDKKKVVDFLKGHIHLVYHDKNKFQSFKAWVKTHLKKEDLASLINTLPNPPSPNRDIACAICKELLPEMDVHSYPKSYLTRLLKAYQHDMTFILNSLNDDYRKQLNIVDMKSLLDESDPNTILNAITAFYTVRPDLIKMIEPSYLTKKIKDIFSATEHVTFSQETRRILITENKLDSGTLAKLLQSYPQDLQYLTSDNMLTDNAILQIFSSFKNLVFLTTTINKLNEVELLKKIKPSTISRLLKHLESVNIPSQINQPPHEIINILLTHADKFKKESFISLLKIDHNHIDTILTNIRKQQPNLITSLTEENIAAILLFQKKGENLNAAITQLNSFDNALLNKITGNTLITILKHANTLSADSTTILPLLTKNLTDKEKALYFLECKYFDPSLSKFQEHILSLISAKEEDFLTPPIMFSALSLKLYDTTMEANDLTKLCNLIFDSRGQVGFDEFIQTNKKIIAQHLLNCDEQSLIQKFLNDSKFSILQNEIVIDVSKEKNCNAAKFIEFLNSPPSDPPNIRTPKGLLYSVAWPAKYSHNPEKITSNTQDNRRTSAQSVQDNYKAWAATQTSLRNHLPSLLADEHFYHVGQNVFLHGVELQRPLTEQERQKPKIYNFYIPGNGQSFEDASTEMAEDMKSWDNNHPDFHPVALCWNSRCVNRSNGQAEDPITFVKDACKIIRPYIDKLVKEEGLTLEQASQRIYIKGHSLGAWLAAPVASAFHHNKRPVNFFHGRSFDKLQDCPTDFGDTMKGFLDLMLERMGVIGGMRGLTTLIGWGYSSLEEYLKLPPESRKYMRAGDNKGDGVIRFSASLDIAYLPYANKEKALFTEVIEAFKLIEKSRTLNEIKPSMTLGQYLNQTKDKTLHASAEKIMQHIDTINLWIMLDLTWNKALPTNIMNLSLQDVSSCIDTLTQLKSAHFDMHVMDKGMEYASKEISSAEKFRESKVTMHGLFMSDIVSSVTNEDGKPITGVDFYTDHVYRNFTYHNWRALEKKVESRIELLKGLASDYLKLSTIPYTQRETINHFILELSQSHSLPEKAIIACKLITFLNEKTQAKFPSLPLVRTELEDYLHKLPPLQKQEIQFYEETRKNTLKEDTKREFLHKYNNIKLDDFNNYFTNPNESNATTRKIKVLWEKFVNENKDKFTSDDYNLLIYQNAQESLPVVNNSSLSLPEKPYSTLEKEMNTLLRLTIDITQSYHDKYPDVPFYKTEGIQRAQKYLDLYKKTDKSYQQAAILYCLLHENSKELKGMVIQCFGVNNQEDAVNKLLFYFKALNPAQLNEVKQYINGTLNKAKPVSTGFFKKSDGLPGSKNLQEEIAKLMPGEQEAKEKTYPILH